MFCGAPAESAAHILYVESEEDHRELLRMLLEPEGYRLTIVGKASEALDLAARNRFDLYILTVLLPDENGIELCRQIRAFDKVTPILFLTVHDDLKQEALKAGAQDLVVKPIHFVELLQKVARWTRK